ACCCASSNSSRSSARSSGVAGSACCSRSAACGCWFGPGLPQHLEQLLALLGERVEVLAIDPLGIDLHSLARQALGHARERDPKREHLGPRPLLLADLR